MERKMNFFSFQREKGRGRKLRLDEDGVRQIRRMIRDGVTQVEIASRMGVARLTVSNVKTKQIWGHVPDEGEA